MPRGKNLEIEKQEGGCGLYDTGYRAFMGLKLIEIAKIPGTWHPGTGNLKPGTWAWNLKPAPLFTPK
jgi:hypothetical protein